MSGEIATCSRADTFYLNVMIRSNATESEDSGYLALKTVTSDNSGVRFRTVMFMKDSTGQCKMSGYHAREGERQNG